MKKGTIVVIARGSAINAPGEIGVVYEDYGTGSSIIFERGGYDGFSHDDLKTFEVTELGFDAVMASYPFRSVMQLSHDYTAGHFTNAFRKGAAELDRRAAQVTA